MVGAGGSAGFNLSRPDGPKFETSGPARAEAPVYPEPGAVWLAANKDKLTPATSFLFDQCRRGNKVDLARRNYWFYQQAAGAERQILAEATESGNRLKTDLSRCNSDFYGSLVLIWYHQLRHLGLDNSQIEIDMNSRQLSEINLSIDQARDNNQIGLAARPTAELVDQANGGADPQKGLDSLAADINSSRYLIDQTSDVEPADLGRFFNHQLTLLLATYERHQAIYRRLLESFNNDPVVNTQSG